MGDNNSKETIFCTECNAEIPKISKFCFECGKPVKPETQDQPNEIITCPNCHTELSPGLNFCTECGVKVGQKSGDTEKCPECSSEISPGLQFCTKCGASLKAKRSPTSADINERLRQKRESNGFKNPPKDENVEQFISSGKSVVKEFGGILNQAVDDLGQMIDAAGNSNSKKNPEIKPRVKPKLSPGYLVCDNCGGYYHLQPGESADDFTSECECGGVLEHKISLNKE